MAPVTMRRSRLDDDDDDSLSIRNGLRAARRWFETAAWSAPASC
jgi:hypothetical protein